MTTDEKLDLILSELVSIKAKVSNIEVTVENELRNDIKLLAEGYVLTANKYEKASETIGNLENDVKLLNLVVAKHSEILKRIS